MPWGHPLCGSVVALCLAACTCPVTTCLGRAQVRLTPTDGLWTEGLHVLEVGAPDAAASARCELQVDPGATAPRALGVVCDVSADRTAYVLDTGGPMGGVVRVSVPLTSPTAPAALSIRLTRGTTTLVDAAVPTTVTTARVGTGTSCASSCDGALVDVAW